MASALTGGEKTSLRSEGQHSELFLAVFEWDTVLERRLDGVPASDDGAVELAFDDPDMGAGAFGDVVVGETLYVSALGYGQFEKGMVRIRKAAGAATLYIGTTSDVDWADNDYLTVVSEVGLWAKHPEVSSDVVFMDYDVGYTDQHSVIDPTPVLGPHYIAWLGGDGTVATSWDGSDSYVLGAAAVASYLWAAPGASATANLNTATPTITYDTAGTYRVSCTVTGDNAATFAGYRYVRIFDASSLPATVLELENCSGDWQAGGWSFRVTMWDEVLTSEIRDRTLVVLFAKDWYDSETSIGPVANRANIIAIGHVDSQSIVVDPEQGKVALVVQGPQFWLGRITGFPAGVEDTDSGDLGGGAATDWTNFSNLTVDKGLWHLLHWQSTATAMMDIQLTADTRQAPDLAPAFGPLWQQLFELADNTILARPCCDRYGRLFVQVDPQLVPTGDRGSIPTVMDLESQDWHGQVNIQRATSHAMGQVNLNGIDYDNGVITPLFSLSPGHLPRQYGTVQPKTSLLLESQAQANELAGLILGAINNEYPVVEIPLASNHRGFDICPHQYATMSLTAAENERGIVWSGQKLTPRRLSFVHDAETGALLTNLVCEATTTDLLATNGDPPPTVPDPPTPDYPSPVTPPPDEIIFPEGPVKAAVGWTQDQLGYTADLLLHHVLSETTAGTTGTALYDTEVDFHSLGVAIGDVVENLDSGSYEHTTVAAIVSSTQLTLSADINLGAAEEYQVCGAQWVDIDDGTPAGTFIQFLYVQTGAATVGGWLLTTSAVYFAANILTPSPSWAEKLSLADMRTEVGCAHAAFRGMASWVQDPTFLIVNIGGPQNPCELNTKLAIYTNDTGDSWSASVFATGGNIQWDGWHFGIAIEQESGDIWCAAGAVSSTTLRRPFMYRSTDGGANFVKTSGIPGTPIGAKASLNSGHRADIYVPYNTPATAWMMAHSLNVLDGTDRCPVKSTDTGVIFNQVGPPGGYGVVQDPKGGVNGWRGDSNDILSFFTLGGSLRLMRSGDGGAAWTELGHERNLFDFTVGGHAGAWSVIPETWRSEQETLIWTALVPSQTHDEARIRFTEDEGGPGQTHWSNMMGNWYTVFTEWHGASGGSTKNGNCGCIALPRVGDNAVE